MKRLLTSRIVIHHTVIPQELSKQNVVDRILRQHKVSPYHILITKDDHIVMRDVMDVAWHANNWPVNLSSVAIALNGNFTLDTMTDYQEEQLGAWTRHLMNKFNIERNNVHLHKEVRLFGGTACPGIDHDDIDDAILKAATNVKPVIERVNEALTYLGDNPARSVGTLNLSRWWQNRVASDPVKFTNDEPGYEALVGAIAWHMAKNKYPHDN